MTGRKAAQQRNRLRGAIAGKNAAAVILDARTQTTPSGLEQLCKLISYQPKGRFYLTSRPRRIAELVPGYVHPATDIQKDLNWAIAQLLVIAPDIAQLPKKILELQDSLVRGDCGHAFSVLDEIEKRFGLSIWGLEARLALTQAFDGLEAQKKLKSEWISNGLNHAALYVALWASERNEDIVSYPNFISRASASLDTAEAPLHWQRLLQFLILKRPSSSEAFVQDVLRASASISVVDLYDVLLWISSNASIAAQVLAGAPLGQKLLALNAPLLLPELYGKTDPAGTLLRAARHKEQMDGWAGSIVEKLGSLLERPGNVDAIYRVLLKVSANFGFVPFGRALPSILEGIRERNFAVLRAKAASQRAFDDQIEGKCSITSAVFSTVSGNYTYDDLFGAVDGGADRVAGSVAALSAGDPQDLVTKTKLMGSFLVGEGRWIEALDVGVSSCIEHVGFAFEIEFDEYLGGRSWRELSDHAGNPVLLLALHFASRYGANPSEKDALERYLNYCALALLQARGIDSFADLGKDESIPLERRVFILYEVFTATVMEIAPFIQSSRELAEARIGVCRQLTELDPGSAGKYTDEIKELTYRVEIQEAAESFDQSRVHVDIDQIKQRCSDVIGEDFARYKSLHGLGIAEVELLKKAIASLRQEQRVHRSEAERLTEQPKTDADNLLVSIINRVKQEYLFNPDAGLDAVLSLRVRHGSFAGYLRGALEEASLITALDSSTNQYKDNRVWEDRLCVGTDEPRLTLRSAFATFSSAFDAHLRQFVDEMIQVRSQSKPNGVIDVPVLSFDFNVIKASISAETSTSDFLNSVLANFELDVKRGLNNLKDSLDANLRIPIEELLTKLRRDLSGIYALPTSGRLFDAIASAGTQVANNIEKIKGWFVYAAQRGQTKPYSMQQILAIAIQVIRYTYPTFHPRIESEFDGDLPKIGTGAFRIADALFIALENVHKHSGLSEPTITVSAVLPSSRDLLLRVTNQVRANVPSAGASKLEELRVLIESGVDDTMVRQEGGTGLLKLWRMSGRGAEDRLIHFGFEGNGFFVEFTIPVTTMQELPSVQ